MQALARWTLATAALLQVILMASTWNQLAASGASHITLIINSGRLYGIFQIAVLVLVAAAVIILTGEKLHRVVLAIGATVMAIWLFFGGLLGGLQEQVAPWLGLATLLVGVWLYVRERKQRQQAEEILPRVQHPAA